MKFTDGNWLLQPGVRAHYPAQAYEVAREGETLVVSAPTRPIRHRGDTLEGPLLTVRLDSPLEDVIRVRIEHFTGGAERGPQVPLQAHPAPRTSFGQDEQGWDLRSGKLSARVRGGDSWELSFSAEGSALTSSGWRSMAYVQREGEAAYLREQLSLGVGESVYGLGERFTSFVKNGQVVEIWNKDGGTNSEQAYKSVPFYLTNRGYGVLVNDTGPVSFEVASERVSRVQFSIQAERLEYFVIYGPTPKEILRRLTALTGRPALPPAWSFGLWLTTSFTTNYDEKSVSEVIAGMKSRDIPLHVFHFDCFWMREFHWTDFQWDPRVFPDPAGLLRRLHEQGLRICVWINPYIAQCASTFAEAKSRGFLLKKPNGEVWQTDQWQAGMGIVDFTNPEACEWFAGHLRRLVLMGVDAFKCDFGERIPTDVAYHDGSDPVRMHNFYPILYNQVVFSALEEVRGKGEAIVFARSSHASGQRFPVHWGGDCHSTFESMAESLRGGLSLGLCGFGYWSHDIGGFEGLPPEDLYKRWTAFGLLSSHSRLHGSSSYRVPWTYGTEACDVLRHFTKLKCRLMPYLFGAAVQAHEEGVPVMRAMMLEFPDDPACEALDRQYMLGDSLLVAPVMSKDGWVSYYLPEGRWTDFMTGETVSGGRWLRTRHDFLGLPLFVRPGGVVPLGARDDRPDYEFTEGATFRVHELAQGRPSARYVPGPKGGPGGIFNVAREGTRIVASVSGAIGAWRLQLAGVASAAVAERASVVPDSLGVIIAPAPGVRSVTVTLPPLHAASPAPLST